MHGDKHPEIHPVAELFPLMTEDEFRELVNDIKEHGQHDPIVYWQGQLIDGRNRLRACQQLGIEPIESELEDSADPLSWVISHNLHRRHLSTGQRSMVASKLATLKNGSNQHNKEGTQNCVPSIDEAATMLNVSPRSVVTAKQVQEHGSDAVKQAVEQGKLPVSLAANLVKAVPDKREQTKLVRQGKDAVKDAVKERTTDRAAKKTKEPVAEKTSSTSENVDKPGSQRGDRDRAKDLVEGFDQKIVLLRAIFDSVLPGIRRQMYEVWGAWMEAAES